MTIVKVETISEKLIGSQVTPGFTARLDNMLFTAGIKPYGSRKILERLAGMSYSGVTRLYIARLVARTRGVW